MGGTAPGLCNSHTLAMAEKLRIDVYYIAAKFQVQQTETCVAGSAAMRSASGGGRCGEYF